MYSERMPARGTLTLYQDGESVKYTISSVKGCGGTSVIYEAERLSLIHISEPTRRS